MAKYKKRIVQDIKEKHEFEREQKALKEKHHLDTEKIVVEKSNMVKFTVNTVKGLIRIIAMILLLSLAMIGLMAVIYPAPREALADILYEIYEQIITFLPEF